MTLLRVMVPVVVLLFLNILGCEAIAPKAFALPAQTKAQQSSESGGAQKRPKSQPVEPSSVSKPQPDPADGVIARAESQYAAGQADYKAGHLEAAKANFDQAFNTLLSSSIDVRSDDRLEREFEKIVEAIHDLEMTALQQGDGFNEQRSEPAPISTST